MYCIECGEKNKSDAKFCYQCGSKMEGNILEQSEMHDIKDIHTEEKKSDKNDKFDYDDISFYRNCLVVSVFVTLALGVIWTEGLNSSLPLVIIFLGLSILNVIGVFILSSRLNKPTWIITIYSLLALFTLFHLIPLIGLWADSNKVLRNKNTIEQ